MQIGIKEEEQLVDRFYQNMELGMLRELIKDSDTWACCDSFLQHLAAPLDKPGVVIWSVSDPSIFGYPHNVNLLKSRAYLRRKQFDIWDSVPYTPDAFVEPDLVVAAILDIVHRCNDFQQERRFATACKAKEEDHVSSN